MSLFKKPVNGHKNGELQHVPKLLIPPDNLPLSTVEPQVPRSERQKVIQRVFELTGGKPGLLSFWIVRREMKYFNGPAKSWRITGQRDDVVAYMACRDYERWKAKEKNAL